MCYSCSNMTHLTFDVSCLLGDRYLLKNVCGEAKPGEVLVIMGASGGGKTTLLDALYGESSKNVKFSGYVRVNGNPMLPEMHQDMSYVQQAEIIEALLTPKEYLTTLAQFFLPEDVRETRVGELIKLFGLTDCQNTLIGSAHSNPYGVNVRGLSGGERRRTYIAGELLRRPSLILLDEPTSGLDSGIASVVFAYIKRLAREYKCTIVMTLHQPSSTMFNGFDKLLLLVGGEIAYFGEAANSIAFFAAAEMPCPLYHNPAEHIIDKLTSNGKELVELHHRKRIEPSDMEKGYSDELKEKGYDELKDKGYVDKPKEKGSIDDPLNILRRVTPSKERIPRVRTSIELASVVSTSSKPIPRYSAPVWTQFWVLLRRSHKIAWRSFNPKAISLTFIFAVIVGLVGVRGKHINVNDERVIVLNAILFLGFIYGSGFLPTIDTMSTSESGKAVIVKEYKAGAYGVVPLFLSKRISEFPKELALPMIYFITVYVLVGLRWDVYLLAYFALMILAINIATAMGVCYSGLSGGDIQAAYALQAIVSVLWLLTMGFYIPVERMPVWIRWLQWAQFYRYGYEGVLRIQYTGQVIHHVAGSNFLSAENLERIGNSTTYSSNILFDQLNIKLTLAQTFGAALGFVGFMNVLALIIWGFIVLKR
jgi:ABC-type multidrug transport system ATPase subunit